METVLSHLKYFKFSILTDQCFPTIYSNFVSKNRDELDENEKQNFIFIPN